ncbi:MAG: putative lipid II flippase FtsW [Armatimonadetes bacterium]|nr:putative lipid II flippase FtsW [Armatimonadota bacterium]
MRRKETWLVAPDGGLLGAVVLLLVAGVFLVFDASYAKVGDAKWANYDIWYMVKRQALYALVGIGVMFWVSKIKMKSLLKITLPLLVISVLMLAAVLAPGVGYRVNGADRWLKAGPISIQPSELAKVAVVLYLAGMLARRKMLVRRLSSRWIGPMCVIGVVTGLIFIEPDLGTAIAIVGTCFIMMFAAGAMKRHLLAIALGGGLLVSVAVIFEPYRLQRIWVWLDPWKDRYGDGYQIIHSLIALGTGGVGGVGLCEGREKLYLPAASTDFILATLGEEKGLIGCLILLGAFMFFVYRGLDVARRCKGSYGNLVAVGITSLVGLQAAINAAVVSASIPATGVPLPFISYGGSALVSMLAATGILLAISRQTNADIEEQDLYESSFDGWRDGRAHLPRHQHRPGSSKGRSRRGTAVRR